MPYYIIAIVAFMLIMQVLLSGCTTVSTAKDAMAVAVDLHCAQPETRRRFIRMEFNRAIAPHQVKVHCVDVTASLPQPDVVDQPNGGAR